MKSPAELRVQRDLTKAFLEADAMTLVLHTRTKVTSGVDKGMLIDGPDRPPQNFRLIIQPGGMGTPAFQGNARLDITEASTAVFTAVLLGYYNAAMDIYDWWQTPEGQFVQITRILTSNQYEKKGLVASYNRTK